MRKLAILSAFAIGLALALATSSFAEREVVQVGNVVLADDGGISPSKLPRRGGAPVTARLIGEIGTSDGTHPPALRTVELEIDKTIELDAVGLPSCRARQIVATPTEAAKRACGDAIVGSGKAEVEVAFADQKPFTATGPVVLFNGGVQGRVTTFLLHAYVAVPAPTAVVVAARVTRIRDGRYGLRISARILGSPRSEGSSSGRGAGTGGRPSTRTR